MPRNLQREVLIACNTLKSEIEHVAARHGIHRRTIWLESRLHNVPKKLASALQSQLDEIEGADRVLLGYANCGNVIQGLRSGDFELVVPRVDDCISLVLGSQERRQRYGEQWRSLFFTDGWLNEGPSILDEYAHAVERYGEEDADDIFHMMYAHYRTMTYIETGLYDLGELMDRTAPIARLCGMEQRTEPGTLDYVEQLICGPWDESRFVVIGPHEVIPAEPFRTPGSVLAS